MIIDFIVVFLYVTLKEKAKLIEELSKYSNCDMYITGHSLGGAMDAIMNNILIQELQDALPNNRLEIQSCYTFGMPRFGNAKVVNNFVSPYAFYKSDDTVPLLPPRFFGFRNVLEEYKLASNVIIKFPNNGKSSIMRLWGFLSVTDFLGHSISQYRKLLKQHT